MNQDSPFQDFSSFTEKSSSKSKYLIIFIVVLVLLVGTIVGLYVLGTESNKVESNTLPVPTQEIVISPTPESTESATLTPSPSVSVTPKPSGSPKPTQTDSTRTALTIAVLNGSGTAGAAKEISAVLNELGYTIKTIGNADAFTYQDVTIRIKKSKSSFLDQLKKDVSANVAAGVTVTTKVEDTIVTDAEVIVGK